MADLLDEAEIAQLYSRLLLDKNVLRFNVSMEEAMTVYIIQSRRDLVDYMSDLFMGERVVVELTHLHHAIEVHVKQLENHVERIFVPDYLKAGYDICVFQSNHRLDFGVTHGGLPRCEISFEGLQRVDLVGLFVGHLVDNSEAALS